MTLRGWTAAAALTLIGCAAGTALRSQSAPAATEDTRSEATPRPRLERIKKTHDMPAMRRHAWGLLADLIRPAPGGREHWETWKPPGGQTGAGEAAHGAVIAAATPPQQLRAAEEAAGATGVALEPGFLGRVATVLYNEPATRFVQENRYLDPQAIRADGRAALDRGDPPTIRSWPEAPAAAMVKAIWWRAPRDKAIAVPLWDGTYDGAVDCPCAGRDSGNDMDTWGRVAILDRRPDPLPEGAMHTVKFYDDALKYPRGGPWRDRAGRVVHLGRFRHHVLTREDVEQLRRSDQGKVDRVEDALVSVYHEPLQAGDALILLGFHIMKNDVEDWSWTTLWWHDGGGDSQWPDDAPPDLPSPWRNYRMDVSFGTVLPWDRIQYNFNPYLELSIQRGVASNCAGCHQRAHYPLLPQGMGNQADPLAGMTPQQWRDWLRDRNVTGLRFVWSLARAAGTGSN